MQTSFYSLSELAAIGFKKLGVDVKISKNVSIYSPEKMVIGDHVRIDDFCILSGEIKLGSYIHISAYTAIYGKFGVEMEDFVTVSGRVMIYSQNDDYSGDYMTNPTVPAEFTNVTGGKIVLKKHAIIGAGSIILPSLTIGEGSCLGAMSLLKSDIPAWEVYAGTPAKRIKSRSRRLIEKEQFFQKRKVFKGLQDS
jgi:galactoside O-acetyltransferase